jgi:cellulose synthase/poly-beta-1,6-N-acetylglucosamine synthase-like glycosyltransferase
MIDEATLALLALALVSSIGFSFAFWSVVSIVRYIGDKRSPEIHFQPERILRALRMDRGSIGMPIGICLQDVAVIVPAHNEELTLPRCLGVLTRIIPPNQIYVASDASTDRTLEIARAAGCNTLDIRPGGGKARALATTIEKEHLCDRYEAILIHDADTVLAPDYFRHALPFFADPSVAVVAPYVRPRWSSSNWPRWNLALSAYRNRLYAVVQLVFQYGQTAKWANVAYIAPGCGSLYRSSVIRKIDITAPGLVIEDFNMTFEVHHKRLGRVVYSRLARCTTQEPTRLRDYVKQVKRWYLGLWQTVWRHGIWPGKFWASLGVLLVEGIMVSIFLAALPFLVIASIVSGIEIFGLGWDPTWVLVTPAYASILFIIGDYSMTILVAFVDRRPSLLLYGLTFPAIRMIDGTLFLLAFFLSFFTRSSGSWTSPTRRDESTAGVATPIGHQLPGGA